MATRLAGTYLSGPYNAAGDHDEYTLIIDQDGYGGAAGTMEVENIDFEWQGEGKSRVHAVLTSTCTVTMILDSTVFSFLNALVAAGEETFKLKVEKNGDLYWMGFILSDLVAQENKPYGSSPILEIRATDGIGRTKNVDYIPAIEGKQTWKTHLRKLISDIGLLDFGYANNSDIVLSWLFYWEEENTTVSLNTDDVFQYYRLDSRIYKFIDNGGVVKYSSVYDVLSDFCNTLNCRFMFSAGQYRFVQTNEYRYRSVSPTNAIIHTYAKDGTHAYSTSSQLVDWQTYSQTDNEYHAGTSDLILFSGSLYKWFAPLNEVVVNYKHFLTQNLNPGWEWNEVYETTETYSEIDYVNGTARIRVRGNLNYRLDYSANFGFSHLKFSMRLKVGNYYLRRTAYFSPSGIGFVFGPVAWTLTAANYEFYPQMVQGDNQLYTMQFDIITPLLLESGDLDMFVVLSEIRYWGGAIPSPYDYNEYYSFFNTNIEVLVGGTLEDQYNITQYTVTNPTTTNSEKYELDVYFGTGPQGALGAVQVWGGLAWMTAEQWRQGTSGTYRDLGLLLAEEILGAQKTPVKRFLATLRGNYEAHYKYKHVTLTGDEYYILLGGKFDVRSNEWSGEWFLISRDTAGLVPNIGIIRDTLPPPIGPPVIGPGPGLPSIPDNGGIIQFTVPNVAGATTTTILNEGDVITTISINAPATDLWESGETIIVMSPDGSVQTFVLAADIEAGDTTISVTSDTVLADFPAGSFILTDPVAMYELALACRCTWLREVFRPDAGQFTVKITVNSGTLPSNTDALLVFRNGLYQTYGASYDYTISGADLVFALGFDTDSDGNKELVVVHFML